MKPTKLLILFSLGILLMVSIIVAGFVMVYEKTTEKQLISYGQMTLDSGVLYVDTIMKSTKDLLDSISLDAEVSKLLNYESLTANDLLTGLRRLSRYESSSYLIDSVYIFNRKNNTVYVSSPHMPEAAYLIEDFPDYEAIKYLLDYSGINNLEPIFRTNNTIYPFVSEIPYISFLRYNMLEKDNTSNVIMVNVRQDILADLINDKHETNAGILVLTDSSGNNHIVSGSKELSSGIVLDDVISIATKSSPGFSLKSGGRKFIVCQSDALNGKAKLILIADEKEVASLTRTKGYGNTIIVLGIMLGICLLLSAYLFRHIWQHIKNQQAAIAKNAEEKKAVEEAKRRDDVLRFLKKEQSAEPACSAIFGHGMRILVLLVIDHYYSELSDESGKVKQKRTLVADVCETIRLIDAEIITVYEEGGRVVLILPEKIEKQKLIKIKDRLEKEFGISISMLISDHCDIYELPNVYEFLCESIPYRFLLGAGSIITTSVIDEHEMTQYSIPDDSMKHFVENVLKLNIPEAMALLQGIIYGMACASYKSAQMCLVNLSIAFDDALCKLQVNNGMEKSVPAGSLVYRILGLDSLDDVYRLIEEILYETEKEISLNKNNRQIGLVSDMKRITKAQCCNRDFSIETVSKELNMSSAYLGKVFKKATGDTFSRFVLNERMSIACQRLADSDEPIDCIVFSVGFGDTPYFYKLFKQINGCTPTKYRESHRHS